MGDQIIMSEKKKKLRSALIIGGVILFVALVGLFKNIAAARDWLSRETGAEKIAEYRAQNLPVLVFFKSPDCSSCEVVQASLDEVYPDYRGRIALVPVDVTEQPERDFVDRTGVQTTPTLLLIHVDGSEELFVGEIQPPVLRQMLADLAGGTP